MIWFVVAFVSVMLVPNVVLIFTEPYGFTTIAASLLIPAGFYLLWAMVSRKTGLMVLLAIPFMILCAFQLVISYLFGDSIIAVDMFTNLLTTNSSEAGELLASIYPAVIGVCVLYIPVIGIAINSLRKHRVLDNRVRRTGVITGAALLAAGFLFVGASEYRNQDFALKYHIFPANVSYNIGVSVKRWNRSLAYPDTSANFTFNASRKRSAVDADGNPLREIYVLIIGEASRAASWGVLGYGRNTTPIIHQRANTVLYKDITTQSNTTHKSVPIILSPVSAENFDDIYSSKSILTLFSEAGFRTAFISNQPPNRSLTDFFASHADTTINLTSYNNATGESKNDIELVPVMRGVIESDTNNLFIVMHTYGSHTAYHKRYPEGFGQFKPDNSSSIKYSEKEKFVNAYDNSIQYTDYVLNKIIDELHFREDVSALFYISDHGEDLMDDKRKRFLHSSPSTTYYQLHVPAFAWFSEAYAFQFTDKFEGAMGNTDSAATTADVFHTMADMAAIETSYANPTRSLFSTEWKYIPRMYLNDHDDDVNIMRTGLKDLDLEQFQQHSLRYDAEEYYKVLF